MDKKNERIGFALAHVLGKSAAIFARDEWEKLICPSGEPTIVTEVPKPIDGVLHDATVVTVTASGLVNPSPGIDIVRFDPEDAPYIYNTDHYTVIENLTSHKDYARVLSVANIQDNTLLRKTLQENVFVVGIYKDDTHWKDEIPAHIKHAKNKV